MTAPLATSPARPEDEPFLRRTYQSARRDEVAAWGWDPAQQEAFLGMQFHTRQAAYRTEFPRAAVSIVRCRDIPVGSMIVDREGDAIHLVDIALLAEFRGQGIGTSLLRGLMEEATAAGQPIQLSVALGNRAARLYERLGFLLMENDGVYLKLKWTPLSVT